MYSFPTNIPEVTHTDAIEETESPPKVIKVEEIIEEPQVAKKAEKEEIEEKEPEPPKKPKVEEEEEKTKPPKLQGMNVPITNKQKGRACRYMLVCTCALMYFFYIKSL